MKDGDAIGTDARDDADDDYTPRRENRPLRETMNRTFERSSRARRRTRGDDRRHRRALSALCALPLVGACAQTIDLKRLAYEALRREDCRRNEIESGFCERGFANEYLEYERLRRDFLRERRDASAEASGR